ncbi:MAG TPA: amidohydrolase family protein, partial [Flavitalea sp.]|nr:amidohydrolase family protein [Flavitalea sp.]
MMKNICFKHFSALALLIALVSCKSRQTADLILHNGIIYTVDSGFSVVQAMAIQDGKIIATGNNETILENFESKNITDLAGKFVYPGFIDAHAHFMGYGLSLNTVNLMETTSWSEVLERVKSFAEQNKE